ncbi:PSD1 and planctomycete cytochrome C domain-containing protein [Allorhodopirellula solitaria]|uniref:Planctomycete cytochrome C n=1 Tax=Allorhodopirellula solitaria TaxID=2527987 RepID=A0A5C5XSE1_9BACT|nr:PSD1 and planctomycete cytochrome C domain-containing protein [Allorhodopirellula solitaria]TWT66127.1 Planctomycete cytochrome C [Allorhodopirellula solitaria]
MNVRCNFLTAAALVAAVIGTAVPVSTAAADDAAQRLFTLKVLPLLKDKCLGCHGGDPADIKGDFSVLSRESLLHGGESEEPAMVPGKPDEGTLLPAIAWEDYEMPPKENDRLTESQIESFRQWIEQGAPWPDESTQQAYRDAEAKQRVTDEGEIVATSGGTSDEWSYRRYQPEDLWAFEPLPPMAELLPDDLAGADAIDHFVDREIEASDLQASGRATPQELIRRATYDLTGLPPTPTELDAFIAADAENPEQAWRDLIERLLASPRYGEHWARHWLDVTRYADTGGMSNDFERSNMWRYRDYVIRAFNGDKPYDRFVIEQLAGDELADESVRQRTDATDAEVYRVQKEGDYTAEEAELLVATGFLRLGPWDNAMIEADEARQIYLDDLVNVTGQTFLSQTLRCCKCHDHKFDPIPTRDYYRIYSAFSTTQMAERRVPFLPEESRDRFDEGRAHVQRMLDYAVSEKEKLVTKREAAAREWFNEHDLPYKNESERKQLADELKPPRHVGLDHSEQGQLKVREQDEWIWNRRLERYQPMVQSVYNAATTQLAWNGARHLRIRRKAKDEDPPQNHILVGGALAALGDQVAPGVLSVLSIASGTDRSDPYLLTPSVEGRRLGLARWIINPDNPLTSRSIVNRIWQHHFGVGLAANANNFGAKGAKPTHPELLNYLAREFVDGGWTIKRMHRLIMYSDAYRRSTRPVDAEVAAESDPNNDLLSHFPRRRLTAEELRDSMLSFTGELVSADGGVPVKPEINMEVALQPRMIQFSLAPAYQPSPRPDQRNRRSIYAYHVRGQADPFTELFNQPNPNESCELRESAAVTPQVFTLLNSDMVTDRAIAFALRLESESDDPSHQIDRAFRLALSRHASSDEMDQLTQYVDDMEAYHSGIQPEPVDYPSTITRSLVEEFSGEPFQYTEILPVFEGYQPDPKPADVSPRTRALADMCLLLLNTNELMYVQ